MRRISLAIAWIVALAAPPAAADDVPATPMDYEQKLATLAPEREQHDLVADACGALEKLRETGGAGLFWG